MLGSEYNQRIVKMKTIVQIAKILLIPPVGLFVVWLCIFSPLIVARYLSDTIFVNITQGGHLVAAENSLIRASWVFVTALFSVPLIWVITRWKYKMLPSSMGLGLKHFFATFVNYGLVVLGVIGVLADWVFVEDGQMFFWLVVVVVNALLIVFNWIMFRRLERGVMGRS